MGAKIIVREEGCHNEAAIAGVAVGYNDHGILVVEDVALDRLSRPERKRIAHELRQLAKQLDPRDLN